MDRLFQYFDPRYVWDYREDLISGVGVTLSLAALTFCLSVGPALLIALGRRFGPTWLARLLTYLVNLCRSVPSLLMVMFIYLALPFTGITLSAYASVLV